MSKTLQTSSSAHALTPLFHFRSIALVGASERSAWARQAYENLQAWEFSGQVYPVNPKGTEFFGHTAYTSCSRIGAPVDAALLIVPIDSLNETLEDLAAAGIFTAVVLTSGFAEVGYEGAEKQAALIAKARELGIHLMGPNSLGFINYNQRIPCWPVRMKVFEGGPVAVVSQSGAMGGYITKYAQQQGVDIGFLAATGNEATVQLQDVMRFLVEDPKIRVIALFAEAIRDPKAFAEVALRAAEQKKPIVILKVGRSELTAQSAQAHTGALVGDDRVFDAACREYGLIRVDSMEEMVETAGLLAQTGPLPCGGLAVLSVSGGAAEVVADECEREGIVLRAFSADTVARLRDGVIPSYGATHNPLDITGAAIVNPALFENAVKILAEDPEIGLLACVLEVPAIAADNPTAMTSLHHIGKAMKAAHVPGLIMNVVGKALGAEVKATLAAHGVPHVTSGTSYAVKAIRGAQVWSDWLRQRELQSRNTLLETLSLHSKPTLSRLSSEREALDYLSSQGVPVVTARLATNADEAIQIAAEFGEPVALKIASPDIAHKSEVGGVLLDIEGAKEVASGFDRILTSVRSLKPEARCEGVLVAPMRTNGVELIVGIKRDPQWGMVLAVGFGGVLVEVLQDVSLRLLPVSQDTVLQMLHQLRGARLFAGYRGAAGVNLDAVAAAILGIGNAALALGPELDALEVNPLYACGDRVEALDGLVIWSEAATPKSEPV